MYQFKIVVGDYSNDGHGILIDFILKCNHKKDEILKAYKNIEKKPV